ncbi:hypothetical protein [Bacillus multifaciens]|uniref:hypothetical protein n=1 Tax=Bacillus multifaciens TaxID=3068506 RepID=UPI0027405CB0|nr:hypothetical protein [Bacillus sp. WLY-B-L8]MDP7981412.1 hypothetical protein [Bacillus sp. WLY-B-L8]
MAVIKTTITVEDPTTMSFKEEDGKIVVSFDGNKELVLPVPEYTKETFLDAMPSPSYKDLTDEYEEFKRANGSIHTTYMDAMEELEIAKEKYEKALELTALGKDPGVNVASVNQQVLNAQMKVETLSKINLNHIFKSMYTPESIKGSYEAGRDKVLKEHYAQAVYYTQNFVKLAEMITSRLYSAERASSSSAYDLEHNIYTPRGYDKNFYDVSVFTTPNKDLEEHYNNK